jgi:hypothetical protein
MNVNQHIRIVDLETYIILTRETVLKAEVTNFHVKNIIYWIAKQFFLDYSFRKRKFIAKNYIVVHYCSKNIKKRT